MFQLKERRFFIGILDLRGGGERSSAALEGLEKSVGRGRAWEVLSKVNQAERSVFHELAHQTLGKAVNLQDFTDSVCFLVRKEADPFVLDAHGQSFLWDLTFLNFRVLQAAIRGMQNGGCRGEKIREMLEEKSLKPLSGRMKCFVPDKYAEHSIFELINNEPRLGPDYSLRILMSVHGL